eukprot:TRINITY_DN1663_c1_g2_i1.p3 TRINITY_DN1663_c1_g2~~TRINITY_DN1663_c1_g2_i1.p3  ORF type:complete len:224 (+),score=116.87 TRINITY_DN1663_c1_g2_i1:86-757(+)
MSSSFLVFATLFCAANAATKTWTGIINDQQWSTANNWLPAGAPGPQDDVVIDGDDKGMDTTVQLVGAASTVKSLTVGAKDANVHVTLLDGLMVSGTTTVGANGLLELNSGAAAISCNDVQVAGEFRFESGTVLGNVAISGKANFGGAGAKVFNGATVKVSSAEDVTALGPLQFKGNTTISAPNSAVVSQGIAGSAAPFQLSFMVMDDSTANSFVAKGLSWKQQ